MNRSDTYIRHVHYYETDRMGIVHHSNYVRWMEEARIDYMLRKGVDYAEIEARQVLMTVTGVSCEYRRAPRFGDTIEIATRLVFFNGVRAVYSYEIYLAGEDALLAKGRSEHCFIDEESRRPLDLKKRMPDISGIMLQITEADPEPVRRRK